MTLRSAVLLLALLACASLPVSGSDEEVRALRVRSTRRSIVVSADDQWAVEGSTVRSGLYQESVELAFDGSVYHPNLMSYDLSAQLGLTQLEDNGPGSAGFSPGFIANLHFLSSWLREKPYTFSLFADRGDNLLDLDLFERARIQETAFGGFGQWNNALAPLYFSVRQSFLKEQQEGRQSDLDTLTVAGGLNRTAADGGSGTRLDYTFTDFDRQEEGAARQKGLNHDVRFSNYFGFGGQRRQRLSSSLYYQDLEGTVAASAFQLAELLELALPWGLEGRCYYDLHAAGAATPGTTLTHSGGVRLSHRLYESLVTSLQGRGLLTDAADYREWKAGPALDLAYRKKIRSGYLNLRYELAADSLARSAFGSSIQVLDESHALRDATVTFLDNLGVDPASVVVSDAAGLTIYSRGLDYELVDVGQRMRLVRVAGGGIADGAQVLVDYLAAGAGSFDYFSLSQTAESRVELFENGLVFYARYHRQRYPRGRGVEAAVLERIDQIVVGASLGLAPVEASAEYEHYASSLVPYDALRLAQNLTLPFLGRTLLTVTGAESFLQLQEAALQTQLDLQAQFQAAVGEFTAVSAGAGYRQQDDSAGTPFPQWVLKAGVNVHRGLLTGSLGYEFRASRPNPSWQLEHTLRLLVRRDL